MMKFGFSILFAAVASLFFADISYGQKDLLGDLNCDGLINEADKDILVELLTTSSFDPAADVNQDGAVDFLDINPFVELCLFALGDGNSDGVVSFEDLLLFPGVGDPYDRQFDFNGNGEIDGEDQTLFIGALSGTATLSIVGDLNGDCLVNEADIPLFINVILSSGFDEFADINQDGVVDLLDVQPFTNLFGFALGEGNFDGVVDLLDVIFFPTPGDYDRQFDFDGDGVVDADDVNSFIEILLK